MANVVHYYLYQSKNKFYTSVYATGTIAWLIVLNITQIGLISVIDWLSPIFKFAENWNLIRVLKFSSITSNLILGFFVFILKNCDSVSVVLRSKLNSPVWTDFTISVNNASISPIKHCVFKSNYIN